ncbi:hypothetical protein L6164_032171 [Bauhinia variegata]|uniref:Uncharacterized protein n=1 Tax=Bauhinia variegata TaxID=167791 RepID=A0ACB9KMX6_BAUVA|nr:hypothetical protein L6164_032171 [Bauhinia variegata]
MAEIPKLDSAASCESFESEQNMGTQKISVSDHINAFQYTAEESDSFVIDMDTFSSGINKDSNTNSRITLQRSLSRKGSQRLGDKKVNGNATTVHDRDTVPTAFSPKAALVGPCTPEKPTMVAVGSTDHSSNPQIHHQITISTGNMSAATTTTTTTESKPIARRNSFRRSSYWVFDPKRVLLFFATLSSFGTILLIYFTLTVSKKNGDEYGGDWQQ